jgi:antitoxin component YwqK of YwqJK toxin-antitoxin module
MSDFTEITNNLIIIKQYYDSQQTILEYEGEAMNNMRHGLGKLYHVNGRLKYEGNFINDFMFGEGKRYHENGQLIYEGNFVNGLALGKGTHHSSDLCSRVEGDFVNGFVHGEITVYDFNNNVRYCGGAWNREMLQ